VIEALRDRIDVVVKALHFNTRFLSDLLARLEAGIRRRFTILRGDWPHRFAQACEVVESLLA
jgi:hypothetical protein